MQRLTHNLGGLCKTLQPFELNFAKLQQCRWARKPIWLPTAKSKIFRIPKRPQIPEEERLELKRLHNNYRTHVKSIRQYLSDKYCVANIASLDPEQIRKQFEQDLVKCKTINDEWNASQKIIREKRVAEKFEVQVAYAKNRITEQIIKRELELEEAEEIVRAEKENAKHFITPEKLNNAIEYALDNPVDYNFAIDLEGNKIVGGENNCHKLIVKQ